MSEIEVLTNNEIIEAVAKVGMKMLEPGPMFFPMTRAVERATVDKLAQGEVDIEALAREACWRNTWQHEEDVATCCHCAQIKRAIDTTLASALARERACNAWSDAAARTVADELRAEGVQPAKCGFVVSLSIAGNSYCERPAGHEGSCDSIPQAGEGARDGGGPAIERARDAMLYAHGLPAEPAAPAQEACGREFYYGPNWSAFCGEPKGHEGKCKLPQPAPPQPAPAFKCKVCGFTCWAHDDHHEWCSAGTLHEDATCITNAPATPAPPTLADRLRAAAGDERLSTGALYLEATEALETAARESRVSDEMRRFYSDRHDEAESALHAERAATITWARNADQERTRAIAAEDQLAKALDSAARLRVLADRLCRSGGAVFCQNSRHREIIKQMRIELEKSCPPDPPVSP